MKNNIKKIVLVVLFCFVISFFTLPAFSKYRSNTSSRIINLFTRYNINYVTAGGRILNPEDFSSYVSVLGLTLPTEDDVDRIGYDFNGKGAYLTRENIKYYVDNAGEAISIEEAKSLIETARQEEASRALDSLANAQFNAL